MTSEVNKKFSKYMGEDRINFVTFHPSLSYEEFVEGIRAKTKDGNIEYYVEDGIFKKMCINAQFEIIKTIYSEATNLDTLDYNEKKKHVLKFISDSKKIKESDYKNIPFVLIIDEINRGNIPKIFGELITLLEPDKRLGRDVPIVLTLPYSKEKFGVPPNLYIIGTMNTADRSLALMDVALRRRFAFLEFGPGHMLEGNWKTWWDTPTECPDEYIGLTIQAIQALNAKILGNDNNATKLTHGKDKLIGHSFAMKNGQKMSNDMCATLWKYEILPLLEEYYNGNYDKIEKVLGNKVFEMIYENNSIKHLSEDNIKEVLSQIVGLQ